MLAAYNLKLESFKNTEYLIQGGSAPLPAVQKKFESMGHTLINGYGLTEAPLAMVNTSDNAKVKPMSIGKPVLFKDIKLLDEDKNEVAPGEIEELAVGGKQGKQGN